MILHTIIDPEWIWNQETEIQKKEEIEYQGIRLEVIQADERTVVIDRVISTNLKDYLNPSLQPGCKLEYTLKSQG
jgi:predicted methyltransferase MtxX (methanogen marker protein 4)